jgi:hypothetical protein
MGGIDPATERTPEEEVRLVKGVGLGPVVNGCGLAVEKGRVEGKGVDDSGGGFEVEVGSEVKRSGLGGRCAVMGELESAWPVATLAGSVDEVTVEDSVSAGVAAANCDVGEAVRVA